MTNPKPTDTSRSGDLVERLRERTCVVFNSPGVHPDTECLEAADRIEALEMQLVEERRLAWNEAIEAAAAYVDGNGGTVIPGATVFAALVSGNFQPCMSGDARDRLPPHTRRRFDAATHTLTQAIRALTKDSTHD